MDFLTLILIISVCSGVYYYFKQKLSYFKDRGVPYEPALPVFGNMAPVLFKIKHISEMVGDIYNAHPSAKYVGAFSFGQPSIVLRDPELIKTVTIKHFDNFQNHSFTVDEKVDPLMGANLFNAKGESWRETRQLLSSAFTSSKLKSMFNLMVDYSRNFNRYISELSDVDLEEVTTKDLFTKYTADVIATCVYGITVDSLKNPNNDIYVLGKKSAIFEGLLMLKFYIAAMFPRLMKLFNIKVITEDAASFFKSTVRSIIETRDKQGISRPDVIQLMMDARNNNKNAIKFDINMITSQLFSFFIGGFDTTSTQMCIIAHELALNPNIQQKLQDEIDRVMEETNRQASYEAMQNMPYFDAVFSESLRRHTEAIILDRACEKPFELPPALPGGKSFVIQPGMKIWISGKSIHMDSKYYENPEKFDPERYYQKKIKNNDALNLGFGIGPRSCIAHRFARLKTKILFFYLLSDFSLVANGRTTPIKYCKESINVKPEGGFCLSITRRNK